MNKVIAIKLNDHYAKLTDGSCPSLLGKAVISKKILCTRKIYPWRFLATKGRVFLRTLIDRKRKRYDNAVDVVVRLHDPTDPSTKRTAPPSSAQVHLDDVPRTLIQQSFTGDLRQHDGDDVATDVGLRLSTATILSRFMVEGGTAHG